MRDSKTQPRIKGITLTGAGPELPLKLMQDLCAAEPDLECGILFSLKQEGKGRFPPREWIEVIAAQCEAGQIRASLHLCGTAVKRYLSGDRAEPIRVLAHCFNRVQLNFLHHQLGHDAAFMSQAIRACPVNVITQHNDANAALNAQIDAPNHQVLFDKSGGRGISPTAWPAALGAKRVGYAGGLGPDNLEAQLALIDQVCSQGAWVDMENKLRTTTDTMDTFAVMQCLRAYARFKGRGEEALRS